MSNGTRPTSEFKWDAVAQVFGRGYKMSEALEGLGTNTKSLYTWKVQFSKLVRVRNS